MEWTVEEENMLHLYNRGSRISTLCAIEEIMCYLEDDPDLLRIAEQTAEKLSRMSDMDYLLTMLESAPAWEEEEEVPVWEEALRKRLSV